MRISKELTSYIYSTKEMKKNDVYETVCLMILNENFLKTLENVIIKNKEEIIKRVKISKKNVNFNIRTTPEYIKAIDLICKTKYFINNFSKEEINRKKEIANNIIVEIIAPLIVMEFLKKYNINLSGSTINHYATKMPNIKHSVFNENGIEKINLTFPSSSPLNEVIEYLKMIDIKNYPKKKKLSLGQSIRLLLTEDKIRKNKKLYTEKIYKNIGRRVACDNLEQLISREMNDVYNENLSEELINKSLHRIKKIKKEINAFSDK